MWCSTSPRASAVANREAQVPALLELLGIPYTGSDPAAMSLTLDKSLAKQIVRAGRTASRRRRWSCATGKERLAKGLTFPLMVKPVAEGSSKGISGARWSRARPSCARSARELIQKYKQDALVEAYLPGREFTVALLGESKPKALPAMEVIFIDPSRKHPIYDFDCKFNGGASSYNVPAKVDEPLARELERVAKRAFVRWACGTMVASICGSTRRAGELHRVQSAAGDLTGIFGYVFDRQCCGDLVPHADRRDLGAVHPSLSRPRRMRTIEGRI